MPLLVERQFQPFGTSHDAMAAAGMWWPKSPAIKVRDVIAEAKDRGVRALALCRT